MCSVWTMFLGVFFTAAILSKHIFITDNFLRTTTFRMIYMELLLSLLYQLLLKITYCIAYGFYIIWTLTYEAQSLYFHVKHFQSCSANHKSSQSKAFYSIYTILLLEKPIKPTDHSLYEKTDMVEIYLLRD